MARAILFAPYFSDLLSPPRSLRLLSPCIILCASSFLASRPPRYSLRKLPLRKRPLTFRPSLRDSVTRSTTPAHQQAHHRRFPIPIEKSRAQSGRAARSSRYSRGAMALVVRVRTMFVIKNVIKSSNYEKRDARSIDRKDGERCSRAVVSYENLMKIEPRGFDHRGGEG